MAKDRHPAGAGNPGTSGSHEKGEGKGGFLSRFFNVDVEAARGGGQTPQTSVAPHAASQPTKPTASHAPTPTQRTAQPSASTPGTPPPTPAHAPEPRMVIPEGVVIEGPVRGGKDVEIHGHINGNVTVEGRLLLGRASLVKGSVQAVSAQVEGRVEGKVECSQELVLGPSGCITGDVKAGKRISIGGKVLGNVSSAETLELLDTSEVQGDMVTKIISVAEGAKIKGKIETNRDHKQKTS